MAITKCHLLQRFLWSILPLLVVVTVVVVVVAVVVVVWRKTKLEFNPLTLLNVAHIITEKTSNFSAQNLLLFIMVSLPSTVLLISRNSLLYSTGYLVLSGSHYTRLPLQPVILTGKNPVTLTRSGVTKRN